MNRLIKVLDDLNESELKAIKQDLDSGYIAKLINTKLDYMMHRDHNKVCPTCHSPVDDGSLSLTFGPDDFRKKARFCAFDCLEYFIASIRKGEGNE